MGNTVYSYLWTDDKLCRVTATVGAGDGASVSYADFLYDADGTVMAMRYVSGETETLYRFVKTYAGDVAAIRSENGDLLAEFTYDAWGNFTYETTPTPGSALDLSSFRYRGYLYDNETDWYYLRSRYYAPGEGRFISADRYMTTGETAVSHNMYAYANDNPVMYVDENGEFAFLLGILIMVAEAVIVTTAVVVAAIDTKEQLIQDNLKNNQIADSTIERERSALEKARDAAVGSKGFDELDYIYYIENQNSFRGSSYKYGYREGWYNTCETIAIFNVLSRYGQRPNLSEVIYRTQRMGGMVFRADWGTNVFKVGKIVESYGLKCVKIRNSTDLFTEGTYIVSYFNNNSLVIHTIFMESKINIATGSMEYYFHNYYIGPESNIPTEITNRFIVGYRVWKP